MKYKRHLIRSHTTLLKLTKGKYGMLVIMQKHFLRGKVYIVTLLPLCTLYHLTSVETTTSYMRSIKDIFAGFMKDRRKYRKLIVEVT